MYILIRQYLTEIVVLKWQILGGIRILVTQSLYASQIFKIQYFITVKIFTHIILILTASM